MVPQAPPGMIPDCKTMSKPCASLGVAITQNKAKNQPKSQANKPNKEIESERGVLLLE